MPISAMIIDVNPEFEKDVVFELEQLQGVEIYPGDAKKEATQVYKSIKGRIIVTTDTLSNDEEKLIFKEICNIEHVLTANYVITAGDEVLDDKELVKSIDKKIKNNNI